MHAPAKRLIEKLLTTAGVVGLVVCSLLESANAAVSIDLVNKASASFMDPVSMVVTSNGVTAQVWLPPPTITYYRDAQFSRVARTISFEEPLYLDAMAAACGKDDLNEEKINISLHSVLTGDDEDVAAYELDPADTHYHSKMLWTKDASKNPVVPNDGILQVLKDDTLVATVDGCGTGSAVANLLVDPAGVVFDSRTNAPIPNAIVTLIDVLGNGNGGHPGAEAVVFADDGVTPHPSTVTTGTDGAFQFPLVAPSRYRLLVVPPKTYTAPSQVAVGLLPNGRTIDPSGSYGRDFEVSEATGAVYLDYPVDGDPTGLVVRKNASRDTAEIAESVEYTVSIQNQSGVDMSGMAVRDDLPAGFTYIAGTAKLGATRLVDPTGGKGPTLRFALPVLAAGAEYSLTYRALLGAGALHGDGVNRAQATGVLPTGKISNLASATVKVSGGVFDESAYVLGKVFADCNANGMQDAGEAGVPGVRVYLADGSFAISDPNGAYSFYGLAPRTTVLKLDTTTLPTGTVASVLTHRNAGRGDSQFLDLKRGELARGDFALTGCSSALDKELLVRNAAAGGSELVSSLKTELSTEDRKLSRSEMRGLAASGIVGQVNGVGSDAATLPAQTVGVAMPEAVASATALASLLPGDSRTAFIGVKDGDTLSVRQITLRTRGSALRPMTLEVNGRSVGKDRIGQRVTDPQTNVELREYVGVELQAGDNLLALVERDAAGITLASHTIHVTSAGNATRVRLQGSDDSAIADGVAVAQVHVQIEDANGVPVAARTGITLEASRGIWQTLDMDENAPGVQTTIEGGAAIFKLRAPDAPSEAQVRVSLGGIGAASDAKARVQFLPQLRPLLAAGVIEGALDLRKLDLSKLRAPRADDGFEQELNNLSQGTHTAGARAALFLKGAVQGKYLVTLGYDSDKDTQGRLFRDIEPDKFYPVYGDSSVKGFDAQSTGRLYVRVDRERSFLLLGDYSTNALSQSRSLGAYQRSLNGARTHFEKGALAVDAFAAHDNARQVVIEIPADGTSGPYALSARNAVENSETVEILVRDRDQPSVILQTTTLQRFTDYEIETFTGHLVLRAPLASLDADLNPHSLRITYEYEQGGPAFWVGGVDANVNVGEHLALNAALIEDRNPQDNRRLASGNATLRLGQNTTLVGELAHNESDTDGAGWGERAELRHQGERLTVRATAGHTDEGFDNPSSSLGADRTEATAKASFKLDERTRLLGQAIHSINPANDSKREGALLGVERSFAGDIKAEVGVRQVHDEARGTTQQDFDTTSVRTRLAAPVPGYRAASLFGEYEQDVNDADRQMAAIGGEYKLANQARIYVRHEFITSLQGPYALDDTTRRNSTVFGLDTRYMGDDRLFSEYRVANGIDGRDAQAALGLRNTWKLADGLALNTRFERVESLSGLASGESAALAAGLEYTRSPLWKSSARLELRDGNGSRGYFSTLGLARKLSDDWTFLGKNVFALTDNTGLTPDRMQERLQFGVAYRDGGENRLNALSRYEYRNEREGTESGVARQVHVVSTHVNYRPWTQLTIAGQYAAKYAIERGDELRSTANAQLIGARLTRDLGKRWDLGAAARVLFSDGFQQAQSALGAEAGFLVRNDLWISTGYNVTGFNDRDLSTDEYTDRGVYVRLRFKFDESLFGRRAGGELP